MSATDLLLGLLVWFWHAAIGNESWAEFAFAWLFIAYCLWDRFVLIMGLYRAHLNKRLHGLNKGLAAPNVVIGFILDVLVNMTWATLVFREWPREWLVTTRLQRHVNDERHSWRRDRAKWWCERVLDPLDPTGKHC